MPDLLYDKHDHYAIFTMNRPERLNALGGTMAADLTEALADFNADAEMRWASSPARLAPSAPAPTSRR